MLFIYFIYIFFLGGGVVGTAYVCYFPSTVGELFYKSTEKRQKIGRMSLLEACILYKMDRMEGTRSLCSQGHCGLQMPKLRIVASNTWARGQIWLVFIRQVVKTDGTDSWASCFLYKIPLRLNNKGRKMVASGA